MVAVAARPDIAYQLLAQKRPHCRSGTHALQHANAEEVQVARR